MNPSTCPKCGSDQVLNDQCLKCGIVLSRYHKPGQPSAAPVSFVATTEDKPVGYTIPAAILETHEIRKKQKLKSALVTAVVLCLLFLMGYSGYRFFLRRAAHYSGMYRNGTEIFVVNFPERDSHWYHFSKDQLKSTMYRDASDAFYRGDDPDEPDAIIGVWHSGITALPERFEPDAAATLMKDEEQSLIGLLKNSGVESRITSSERVQPGGNDGFRWQADIEVDGKPMKLIALRAYYMNNSYWILMTGSEDEWKKDKDELETMLSSFSSRVSML